MAKKFNDLVAKLPIEAQKEIDFKAKEAMAEVRNLASFSQQELARQLGISQPALSKMKAKKTCKFLPS